MSHCRPRGIQKELDAASRGAETADSGLAGLMAQWRQELDQVAESILQKATAITCHQQLFLHVDLPTVVGFDCEKTLGGANQAALAG